MQFSVPVHCVSPQTGVTMFDTHVFALIWYPMLQLVTVHVLYADHIPVALLHVLV